MDYLFDVKYDGNSFDGKMEIGHLALELKSLNFCLNEIILALKNEKRTDLVLGDYSIVVEAFQNNCFKKRIKLITKKIEKYPATTAAVVAIFIGVINAIPLYIKSDNKISPELLQQVTDSVSLKLLSSSNFRQSVSNIVAKPLEEPSDKSNILPPPESNIGPAVITYKEKNNYIENVDNVTSTTKEEESSAEHTRNDLIYGRIVAMDLDATVQQIDFKIFGDNRRVHGTLSVGLNINDYKNLLGEFVEIDGIITEAGGIVKAMEIKKIFKSEEPGQIQMFKD